MAKYEVAWFDLRGAKRHSIVRADDEAGALGTVLDEHGEDIGHGAPFSVCQVSVVPPSAPKRTTTKPGLPVVPARWVFSWDGAREGLAG